MHAVGLLRLVLEFAVEEGRITRNVARGVQYPADKPEDRHYLTVKQVEALAGRLNENYALMVRIMAYCGPRTQEVFVLRGKDVLLDRRRIWLRRAVSWPGGKAEIKDLKSHHSRSIAYPEFLHEPLAKRVKEVGSEGLLFTTVEGAMLNRSNYYKRVHDPVVAELVEELGGDFPRVRLHELRHTAASLAVRAGANPKAVQTMLGHASAAMTLDTYSDLFPDDLDRVAESVGRLIEAER